MHVAGLRPQYLSVAAVPEAVKQHERQTLRLQVRCARACGGFARECGECLGWHCCCQPVRLAAPGQGCSVQLGGLQASCNMRGSRQGDHAHGQSTASLRLCKARRWSPRHAAACVRTRVQAGSSNKPPAVVEKMVEGRLAKHFEECVLLEQRLLTDDSVRVKEAISRRVRCALARLLCACTRAAGSRQPSPPLQRPPAPTVGLQPESSLRRGTLAPTHAVPPRRLSKAVNVPLKLAAFLRVQCGEGLEGERKDFAAEVSQMAAEHTAP